MKFLIILLFIFHQPKELLGANILAIQSSPFYSHQLNHYSILKKLADNGHNLTVISVSQMDFGSNNVVQHVLNGSIETFQQNSNVFGSKVNDIGPFEYFLRNQIKAGEKVAQLQLEYPIIDDLFHNKSGYNFDILIIECTLCMFTSLAEIYGCPIVFIFSADLMKFMHSTIGNFYHSSVIPEIILLPVFNKKLSFFQRVFSYWSANVLVDFWFADHQQISQQMLKAKFPSINVPSEMISLMKRTRLILAISSKVTSNIRPTVPNYHQIGFLTVNLAKNLTDANVKQFLDSSTNGVVLVSFGTVINDINDEIFEKFLNIFKELPFNVLWKIDPIKFQHVAMPKNILLSKWLQLSDILAHPNVKLLIGHGGSRTIEEAIDREVPIVSIPFNYDQHFYSVMSIDYEIGKSVDFNKFTKESLSMDIMEMTNAKYKGNVRKLKALAYDHLGTQVDEAVDNIEHLIKHKDVFHFSDYIGRQDCDFSELFNLISMIIARLVRLMFAIFEYFFR